MASDLQTSGYLRRPISGFGVSLSGGFDMDGQGYTDILVGAHNSSHVVVLRYRLLVIRCLLMFSAYVIRQCQVKLSWRYQHAVFTVGQEDSPNLMHCPTGSVNSNYHHLTHSAAHFSMCSSYNLYA